MTKGIFNITAIRDMMNDPPKAQRIHKYFHGEKDAITEEQKLNILRIIDVQTNVVKAKIQDDIVNSH